MSAGSGMGSSYRLPSGMLESLADYKAALKEVKKELRDAEEAARKTSRAGGDLSSAERRLESLRGRRSNLEEIIDKQRADKKDGGVSVGEFLTWGGLAKAAGSGIKKHIEDQLKEAVYQQRIRRMISNAVDDRKAFQVSSHLLQQNLLNLDELVKIAKASPKLLKFEQSKLIKKQKFMEDLLNGALYKRIMDRQILKGFWSPQWVAGMGGSTTVAGALGAGAVGAGLGYAVGTTINYMAESEKEGGLSAIRRAELYHQLDKSRSLGTGTAGVEHTLEMIRKSEAHVNVMNLSRLRERSLIGQVYEWTIGESAETKRWKDKVAEDITKRQLQSEQFGGQLSEMLDENYIQKNQRGAVRDKMIAELNPLNRAVNFYMQGLGMSSDTFLDYTWWLTLGATGNDVEDARKKAYENIKNENLERYHKEIKEVQDAWNNKENTIHALDRIDSHNREVAVSSYNTDKLTRGLVWTE